MQVYTGASISLDGFIAGPEESGFEFLFAWMGAGDVPVPTADPDMTDQVVGVNAGEIAQQCLDAGLLDEVWVDVAPVYLGDGTPCFPRLGAPRSCSSRSRCGSVPGSPTAATGSAGSPTAASRLPPAATGPPPSRTRIRAPPAGRRTLFGS